MKFLLTTILSIAILLPVAAFATPTVTQSAWHDFTQDCPGYTPDVRFIGVISAIAEFSNPDSLIPVKSIKINYPPNLSHCVFSLFPPQFGWFEATVTQGSKSCDVSLYNNEGSYYCKEDINPQLAYQHPIHVKGKVMYEYLGPGLPPLTYPFDMKLHS